MDKRTRYSIKEMGWRIVLLLFLVLPILDSINGWLLRNKSITIGPLYHMFYAVILFLISLWKDQFRIRKQYIGFILLFILSFALPILLNHVFDSKSVTDVSRAIKYITTYIYIYSLIRIATKYKKLLPRILDYSSICIPVILLFLRVTGLGYNYYSGGTSGYVGWYSSLDELAAILIVLLLYTVTSFKPSQIVCWLRMSLILISMILLSSKASIIMMAIVMAFFLGQGILKTLKSLKTKKQVILLICVFIVIVVVVLIPVIERISVHFISRQKYLMANMENSGILSYLSTGRLDRFSDLVFEPLRETKENNIVIYLLRIVFGNGFMHSSYYGLVGDHHFEMDVFDSYYWMGILGVIMYFYTFFLLWKDIRKIQTSKLKYVAFWAILFVSSLIGHVLFAGVASIYFSVFYATLRTNKISGEGENKCLNLV